MIKLWRRISYLLRRDRLEAELAEEMEFHRDQTTRALGGDRAAAGRAMGNATLAREDARGVWIVPWIESFWQDLAYAFRNMRRQKGFTLLSLTTLSLAIGLNTSLFTVFNAIALRPWPVKDPASVVNVFRVTRQGPERGGIGGFGIAEHRYLAEHSRAFAGMFVMREGERVRYDDQPLNLTYVSGNYFSVLGAAMELGRGFVSEEDRVGAPQAVVVLAYACWQNHFGGNPAILGSTIRLDDVPFIVVGVTAREFTGTNPQRNDFWTPFPARILLRPHDPGVMSFLTSPDYCCSSMAARLAPGYTRAQAAAELELLLKQWPGNKDRDANSTVLLVGTALVDTPNSKRTQVFPIIGLLFLAITLVLLLACANVGNLLLARAAARRTEIAVRLALGGSRLRLIRQLLVESMALAACAAAIGLAIAWFLPSYLVARLAPEASFLLAPDLRVAAYTATLAIVACIAFGLAPALHGTSGEIAGAMKTGTALASRFRLRSALLAAQVAISVILLSGAGLLVRGLERAQHQNPGFALDNVTVVSLDLPANAYGGSRTREFARQLQTDLETSGLPLVGVTKDAPMANSRSWTSMRRTGEPRTRDRMVAFHEVTGGYFDVLGIPVVQGRNFVREDFGRKVVILNQAAAKASWPGESAVGQTILSNGDVWEVVGVVKDAYTTDLNTIPPTMYWPMSGRFDIPQVLVRGGPAAIERVAAVATRIDPKARIQAAPLSENFRALLQPARYGAAIAGLLGVLALTLASIGMSGVFAYVVRQRTREIGVRMALGASQWQVVRLVLASNLRALALGLAIGLAGAAAVSRVLVHQVSQISALDPVAYAGVFLLLAIAAVAAGAIPARRAARVDPVRALRWE